MLCFIGGITSSQGAIFEPVLPRYSGSEMALLIQGEIVSGDSARLITALATAEARYTDHRMRAIALDSPGGNVVEAAKMAFIIHSRGFVTAVPKGAVCASACVLLFAAGSRKIVSAGAALGVHGAAIGSRQTEGALAVTTLLAKALAAYGTPASVIGRMAVTPPDQVAWLTAAEIKMFPWGYVTDNLRLDEVPYALAGLDYQLRQGPPPLATPAYQRAGPSLPISTPPPNTFGPAPPHSAALIRRARAYSAGYAYGESIGASADCEKAGGAWHQGCTAGSHEQNKYVDSHCLVARQERESDPLAAAIDRDWCSRGRTDMASRPSAASYMQIWLQEYDEAYTEKKDPGDCGNGAAPGNDGCRAGAETWLRTESRN